MKRKRWRIPHVLMAAASRQQGCDSPSQRCELRRNCPGPEETEAARPVPAVYCLPPILPEPVAQETYQKTQQRTYRYLGEPRYRFP